MKRATKGTVPKPTRTHRFPIVGIGASAGGLEAFTALLTHLTDEPGFACVLVQHLDPSHESLLADIVRRSTKLPVEEATDGKSVEKNHVYVIPPNATMTMKEGKLLIGKRGPQAPHLPIDIFFTSLAADQGEHAIGVVLSGTGADGTQGVEAIKAAGGMTFAQEEATSRFTDMPHAAVDSGCVDFVLSPARTAQELERLARVAGPFWGASISETDGEEDSGDHDLAPVLVTLRKQTGMDFRGYKLPTLRRRTARRMAIHRMTDMKDYVALLRKDKSEAQALHKDILIKVTSFFREPEAFEQLATRVIPSILARRGGDEPIRVWVPGCCTGEEAYSIAMVFHEATGAQGGVPVQVFATDLSEMAIEKARTGLFSEAIASEISEARLRRFFTARQGKFQISKTIRDMCVLATHDVTRDPPFSHLDLVSCRNLLIYLTPVLQRKVLQTFHYALKPGGFLMLGNSESLGAQANLFSTFEKNARIFVRRETVASRLPPPAPTRLDRKQPARNGKKRSGRRSAVDVQKDVEKLILARFSPPGVLVTEDLEVIQFRGQVAPYITPAPGKASFSLLKMAHPSLNRDLQAVLQEAVSSGDRVRSGPIQLRQGNDLREVQIEVFPISPTDSGEMTYLVLFEQARSAEAPGDRKKTPATRRFEKLVEKLQQELAATRESLQMTVDQQEATHEEYKSANEEILSSNEELQSTNEELETAKEELQSANEELMTVNEELQTRNADLLRLSDDFTNLLASVNIPIVMIGLDGHIRRFTPAIDRIFSVVPTDVGRPLSDIRARIQVPDLDHVIQEALTTAATIEREVKDDDGRWYLMTLRPYRTRDNRTDGAVLVFFDIDAWKRTAGALQTSREFAEKMSDTVRQPILFLDSTLRIINANRALANFFQTTLPNLTGHLVFDLFPSDIPALRDALLRTLTQGSSFEDLSVPVDFGAAGKKTLNFNGTPISAPGSGAPLVLMSFEPVKAAK